MADTKVTNEVNVNENVNPDTVQDTEMNNDKKKKKAGKGKKKIWKGLIGFGKGAAKIGLGIFAGCTLVGIFSKPKYIDVNLNQAPMIDAHEGIDFVPAPEKETIEA